MTDSRSRMIERIRQSLSINRAMLEAQAAAYPAPHPHGPFVATDLDVVEQFRTELSALHAHVHICNGADEALEQVFEILEQAQAGTAFSWGAEDLPIPQLSERLHEAGIITVDRQVLGPDRAERYTELERVPVGITGVDAAIAESGSMLVVSGAERNRLASLLPPLHIALLPAERIVRTLPDALAYVRDRYGNSLWQDHANLVVITGPSRTADIELSLTLGVHGPREVHAVVIR